MIRAVFLRRVRRFIVFDLVWRKGIEYEIAASFSDEVSQQGVLRPQRLWEQQRNLWETTEKLLGAWFLEYKQSVCIVNFVTYQSAQVSWAKVSPHVSGVYTVLIL